VVVKVSPDSQMKKLPAEMAQRIAMRLKGAAGSGNVDQPGAIAEGPREGMSGQGGRPSGNGPPDFQRMLSRLPNSTLADLQKGDAVMIVSTTGGDADAATAVTLLAGVDAILTAAPSRSASTLLSPWSLSAPGGEGEAAQQ